MYNDKHNCNSQSPATSSRSKTSGNVPFSRSFCIGERQREGKGHV